MQIGIAKKPVDKLKYNSKKIQLTPKKGGQRNRGIKNRVDKLKANNKQPHQYINYIKYKLTKHLLKSERLSEYW